MVKIAKKIGFEATTETSGTGLGQPSTFPIFAPLLSTEEQMSQSTPSRPRTLRNLFIWVGMGALLIIGFRMAYVWYSAIDYAALNKGEWKTVQVGIPFVQFESPVTLADKSRPPLGKDREFVRRNQSFLHQNGFDLYVAVTIVDYHTHVFIDPAAVVQSVKNFDQQFGASDITFERTDLIIGTYKAQRVEGTFMRGGHKYQFTRINAEYRNNFRDLLVIVRADDPEATRLKNRMTGTILFEPL